MLDSSTNENMLTFDMAISPWGNYFFSFFSFFLLKGETQRPPYFVWNYNIDRGKCSYFHWNNRVWTKKNKRRKIHNRFSFLKVVVGGAKKCVHMLMTS